MKKIIKEAFITGYEQGHNDTVESGYNCPEDKADDYYIEISNRLEKLVMQLPDKEEILKVAVTLSDNLTANEQAFFVAGFQECIKYLQKMQSA